jgi:predicted RNase H-like nuclease (RuvC/YqgF family)
MEAKVAVATVSGKAYYLVVNELKARGIDFLSLMPHEPVPLSVQVVITTEKERDAIKHQQVLVYDVGESPSNVVDETVKLIRGKRAFETIAVGIDPGKTFGMAVLSDGNVLETLTCNSLEETVNAVTEILSKHQAAVKMIKVGNLAPSFTTDLLQQLDQNLPHDVTMEVVHEAGTSRVGTQTVHKRGLRHAMAAVRIAERQGRVYLRKGAVKTSETNG